MSPVLVDIPFTPSAPPERMEKWLEQVDELLRERDDKEVTPLEWRAIQHMREMVAGWMREAVARQNRKSEESGCAAESRRIWVRVYRSGDEPHPAGVTLLTHLSPGESFAGHSFDEWKSKENKAVYLDTFADIDLEEVRRQQPNDLE